MPGPASRKSEESSAVGPARCGRKAASPAHPHDAATARGWNRIPRDWIGTIRSATGSGRKELVPAGDVQNALEEIVEAIEVGHRLDFLPDPLIGRAELLATQAKQRRSRLLQGSLGFA